MPFVNFVSTSFSSSKSSYYWCLWQTDANFDKFHRAKAGVPVGGGLLIILVVCLLFGIAIPILSILGRDITSVYANQRAEMYILFYPVILWRTRVVRRHQSFFISNQFGILVSRSDLSYYSKYFWQLLFLLLLYFSSVLVLCTCHYWHHSAGTILYSLRHFYHCLFFKCCQHYRWTGWTSLGHFNDLSVSVCGFYRLNFGCTANHLLGSFGSARSFRSSISMFSCQNLYGRCGLARLRTTLAVVGLLLGKVVALVVIGFIFVLEISSSLIQLMSKMAEEENFASRSIHLTFQAYGWEEPKLCKEPGCFKLCSRFLAYG